MTRRRKISVTAGVAAALVLSVLAASAPPIGVADAEEVVQAADGLVVVSTHNDFGTDNEPAPTLDDLRIDGSGESADVTLPDSITFDDFEGDLSNYGGDTADASIQTSVVQHGSSAVEINSDGYREIRSTSLADLPDQGDSWSVWLRGTDGTQSAVFVFGAQAESNRDNQYQVNLDYESDSISLRKRSGGGESALSSTSTPLSTNTWYRLDITWGEDGSMSVSASTGGSQVATVSATDTSYESGGIGVGMFAGAGADSVYADYIHNPSVESGSYVSAVHDVSSADQAAVNVTSATNVSINTTVRTQDGTLLASDTTTSTGINSFSLPNTDSSQLTTTVKVSATGANPDFSMADESILFTPHAPQASNIQPTDNTTLSENEVQLSVDVSDADFATVQGDSVDATFYVDGEEVSSETLTSNGTATANVTKVGQSEWYAELEDEYGQTVQTDPRTFGTPSTLRVLNELRPQELVDGNISVTVRAYAGETAISRNVTDGTMSLTGLPVDQPIVITTEAETYVDRRIIIEDITEQQRIYMLNASAETVPITFQVSDKTGRYPPESSRLAIEKAVNVSDEDGLKWQTISGDYFSADLKFPTTLADGQRYRVVIKNADGDQRVLGSYIPYEPTVTTLSIGEIVWDIPSSEGVYSTTRYDENGNLKVLYNDTRGATTQLNVTAWNRSTGEQVYQGITSDVQRSVETIPVDGDVVVSVQAERDGEPDYSYRGPVGDPDIEQGLPFGRWLKLVAQVLMLGIAGLVVGHMPKQGGLVIVPIAFGIAWMGIWEIHPASLGIAGALALAAATNRGGP